MSDEKSPCVWCGSNDGGAEHERGDCSLIAQERLMDAWDQFFKDINYTGMTKDERREFWDS